MKVRSHLWIGAGLCVLLLVIAALVLVLRSNDKRSAKRHNVELEYLKFVNSAAAPRDPELMFILMNEFANSNLQDEGVEFFSACLSQFDPHLTPIQKSLYLVIKCGSNCLRHALKNSTPSSCRFEFANSVINMNISSGSLGAAALFTNFRYSSSTLCRFAERVSLLRRTRANAAITSRRTHSPAPIHK